MSKPARSRQLLRLLAVIVGLALPTLTLVPLGSLWLWERGLLWVWAIVATSLVVLAYATQRWLLPEPARPAAEPAVATAAEAPESSWSPIEVQAWDDVIAIARRSDPAQIATQQQALALAFDTIKAVAHRIHPEVSEPLWQFTVPEAFAMLERVSARLGTFAYESVPLSDRLTVGQALALYRWRGTVEGLEKAYDIWRLVRMANPMSAATGELRDRLSRQMMQ